MAILISRSSDFIPLISKKQPLKDIMCRIQNKNKTPFTLNLLRACREESRLPSKNLLLADATVTSGAAMEQDRASLSSDRLHTSPGLPLPTEASPQHWRQIVYLLKYMRIRLFDIELNNISRTSNASWYVYCYCVMYYVCHPLDLWVGDSI